MKSGDDIVLTARYTKIEPCVGSYCAYSIAKERWGVLSRRGRVIVSPEYKRVNVLPDGTAVLSPNGITEHTVNLIQAEQEENNKRKMRKYYQQFQKWLAQKHREEESEEWDDEEI